MASFVASFRPPPALSSVQPRRRGRAAPARCAGGEVSFREANQRDQGLIFQNILRERMNPAGLKYERFTAAVDVSGETMGFGQIKNLGSEEEPALELSSLVVLPEHRGKGVGTELVRKLVAQVSPSQKLYLLCLGKRAGFYTQAAGFEEVPLSPQEVPLPLLAEALLGNVVSRVLADDRCVVMRR